MEIKDKKNYKIISAIFLILLVIGLASAFEKNVTVIEDVTVIIKNVTNSFTISSNSFLRTFSCSADFTETIPVQIRATIDESFCPTAFSLADEVCTLQNATNLEILQQLSICQESINNFTGMRYMIENNTLQINDLRSRCSDTLNSFKEESDSCQKEKSDIELQTQQNLIQKDAQWNATIIDLNGRLREYENTISGENGLREQIKDKENIIKWLNYTILALAVVIGVFVYKLIYPKKRSFGPAPTSR